MTAVSCGFLLYAVHIVGRPAMLLVVPVFLLVVLVHADGWVSAGSFTIPTGSYSFMLLDWFLLVAMLFLLKGKGWEAYEQILDFLNRSYLRYALIHRPPFVFDSLVKQFWAITNMRTLETWPSEISATINEVVVTESLIRTQLQLNDMNGLYEFTQHDVLDGMREIGYPTHGSLTFYKLLQMTYHRLHVPPTHTSSSTPGPSPAAQDTPVREPTLVRAPTPVREPIPSSVREATTFREPTHASPRPPSPPPYPRSEEVGPTTSTRPHSLTRQTSSQEDISEGGGDYVSSPKSNEAPPTTAAIAIGGAEDYATLTDLSLKIDMCITRVTTLKNELGVTKTVLGSAVLKLVFRLKRLEGLLQQRKRRLVLFDSESEEAATKEQDIDLDALHKLASTSLGGDTTVEAAYTIYKASQDAHASSDAGHDADVVPDDTTMPFRRTRTKRRRLRKPYTSSAFEHFQENISVVEDTILAGGAAAAAPFSTILAADKGKSPMIDDSLPADLLTKQEHILKNLYDYQLGEDLAKKLHAKQPTPTLEAPSAKRARQGVPQDVHATSSQVPAGVSGAPSIAVDVSVFAAPSVNADTEVHADESHLDDPQTASEHVSTEHPVDESTPSSSRTRCKQISKKRVTPIVDVADDALIKFDSASNNDDDPFPYAPFADWDMVPYPLGSIHAYYDMEEHTKQFTSLRDLHVLFQSLADEDAHAFWCNQDSWCIRSWRLYPRAQVHVLETMDGRVIYIFVDVSYPLSAATLKRMLQHGLEVPKLLVGGDLTMVKQLVSFIKAALLSAQSAV
uniref:Aminoacyl-tRNA synthetase, class 1a, anticodon-binding n=1 Tax=Tanacetum cinerariifolium TaxID=118510 RepID=A0A6L2JL86_TANCI|nr:hypothetical protein [Tanacetum cinerariifolium]